MLGIYQCMTQCTWSGGSRFQPKTLKYTAKCKMFTAKHPYIQITLTGLIAMKFTCWTPTETIRSTLSFPDSFTVQKKNILQHTEMAVYPVNN